MLRSPGSGGGGDDESAGDEVPCREDLRERGKTGVWYGVSEGVGRACPAPYTSTSEKYSAAMIGGEFWEVVKKWNGGPRAPIPERGYEGVKRI